MGSIYYLKISVSLAVAAIPEGLPTVITACLALGTIRLTEKKSIIKELSSIEKLGNATVICTSTIGLTIGNPKVSDFFLFDDSAFKLERFSLNPSKQQFLNLDIQLKDFKNRKQFVYSLFVNNINKSEVEKDAPESAARKINHSFEDPIYQFVSEFACFSASSRTKKDYLKLLHEKWKVHNTMVFDSQRKVMSTLASAKDKTFNYLFIKGDPIALLSISHRVLLKDNTYAPLEDSDKEKIMDELKKVAANGVKIMGVAYKKDLGVLANYQGIPEKNPIAAGMLKDPYNYKTIEDECDLIGFIGISNPIRPEIKNSIERCNKAGIQIYLMSGNLQETAEKNASELGFVGHAHITSQEIDNMGSKGLTNYLREAINDKKNMVFSQITDHQKKKVVKSLQSLDQVVVMTGRDASDESGMAQSDIPVAFGMSATDGALDKAAIILADDNFDSIVNAIEEGRGIYENMKVPLE